MPVFRSFAAKSAATILVVLGLLIFLTNGQLFSVAGYLLDRISISAGLSSAVANGKAELPPQILGATNLIAIGDIAKCDFQNSHSAVATNLMHSFGIKAQALPNKPAQTQIAQILEESPGEYFLPLGDLVYDAGSPAEYANCYEPMFGKFADRTFPIPGNHDYRSLFANGYYGYWHQKKQISNSGYYSYLASNWLVLALNSESDVEQGSRQFEWIKHQISGYKGRCILAYFHSPAYSSNDRYDSSHMRPLFELLYNKGVSVILSGHNHFYERLKPLNAQGVVDERDGVQSFIVGSGGDIRRFSGRKSASSAIIISDKPGLLKLKLMDDSYKWKFVEAATKTTLDHGQSNCRENKPTQG